jgi:hypothetical protein
VSSCGLPFQGAEVEAAIRLVSSRVNDVVLSST